jgi:predicted ATP-dependent endonuclease of OLD family
MQLSRVVIKHFRSIQQCSVHIENLTAFVGENNSGKSAFLRALNLFFNWEDERSDALADRHQYSSHSNIQIEVVFTNIPADPDIARYKNNNELHLKLRIRGRSRARLFQYRKAGKWTSIDSGLLEKVKKYVSFVFIPPVRSKDEILWREQALLKLCVDAYLENKTERRDTFTKSFVAAARDLEKRALQEISRAARRLYALNHDLDYEIRYSPKITYKDFLTSIEFKVKEQGQLYDLEDCGTGIQSLTIIGLHRLLAEIRGQNVILGLEEPETNLHPQAQKELVHSIKQAAENNEFAQIVCTTHSPVVVDQLAHTQVKLCRKVVDPIRGFKTEVSEVSERFLRDNGLEEFKYYRFHQYRNSEFFFARLVVVVEGEGDIDVVKALMHRFGFDLDLNGVSFVHLRGVGNVKYPHALLTALKLPYIIIVDKDFFLPYSEGSKAASRDENGFFRYKSELKDDDAVRQLLPTQKSRSKLVKAFAQSHTKAQALLDEYNIVCMRWCLEMDLVNCRKGAQLLYDKLGVPVAARTVKELLVNRSNKIKDGDVLIHVISQLPKQSFPRSLLNVRSRIRSAASE